jgi:hypothetical protein
MRRTPGTLFPLALPLGAVALALLTACGGSSASNSGTNTPPAPTTGSANILITDAPSDDWSTLQVQVTSVDLFIQGNHTTPVNVYTGAANINLVDMDSIGELLASASIPAGTYDQMKVTINTDPTTMSIIPEGSTTPLSASQIHVMGNGIIPVDLNPTLAVTAGGSNAVQVDFDLSHPLFITTGPTGDVVINFQLKHKPNPIGGLHLIHLHRNVGSLTSLDAPNTSFLMHTRHGKDITLKTDNNTLFYDVDAKPFVPGSFAGLAATDAVMVASRLQDDGSLYAVRVWYCTAANAASLPIDRWSPEGHVVAVYPNGSMRDPNPNMVVDNADGNPRTVEIGAGTTFTFQQGSTIATGPAFLANIHHGFKVSIDVKDPLAKPLQASAVNIQRAMDTGVVNDPANPNLASTVNTEITYGQQALNNLRNYAYSPTFSWWDFAQPSKASTSIPDFLATLTGAGDVRVVGYSSLIWDGNTSLWNADNAILEPVDLRGSTITQNYDPTTGILQISYTPSGGTAETKTLKLTSATGGGQTVVMKVVNQNGVVTMGLDDPSNWAADLTTTVKRVRAAVVPQADGSLLAYSLVVFE